MGRIACARWFIISLALLTTSIHGCPGGGKKVDCGPPIVSTDDSLEGVTGRRVILRGSFRLPPEDEAACQRQLGTVEFEWQQIGVPEVTIENADQQEASFIATIPGDYSFRFRAIFPGARSPEKETSNWVMVGVTIAPRFCGPPSADAGDEQLLAIETDPITVHLDGSRSHPMANCPDLELIEYTWSVVDQPGGADVQIVPGDTPEAATFEAGLPGDYILQLRVQDSAGSTGRTDTGTDSVLIQVVERTPCEDTLEVEVHATRDDRPVAEAHVLVVDAAGASHTADTNANGLVSFSDLAPGRRRSITVRSDETVAALPGSGDPDERLRYQVVTVLEHCSGRITIPLELTASGRAAIPHGIVTAKVPQSLFDGLPHSTIYAGLCSSDDDCSTGYLCKLTDFGDYQCTPRSLLPFFGIDDPNISGQFRGMLLLPVLPVEGINHFPISNLLAPPPTDEAILPGNMATDDAFLNGLASGLGIDVCGDDCDTVTDCPDDRNYVCDPDEPCRQRCRDITPLHNLRVEAPAGTAVPLILLTAVIDVGMENLLPVMSSFLSSGDEDLELDAGGLLGAFKLRTLHVCLLAADVSAGVETDITDALAGLSLDDDCWKVDFQQQEVTIPVPDSTPDSNSDILDECPSADKPCSNDADCCFQEENLRCLPADPERPDERYCFIPLYRVRIVTDQDVELVPDSDDPQPTALDFDQRLCGDLPAEAPWRRMCEGPGNPPLPEPCQNEPEYCYIALPVSDTETECAVPYGLSVVAADFPEGHARLPDGGRVILGFYFNVSPFSVDMSPKFLVPPLEQMGASRLVAAQRLFRNIRLLPDGRYRALSGQFAAAAVSRSNTRSLALPPFLPWGRIEPPPPDTGLDVKITFKAIDPLAASDEQDADCDQLRFDRVYATMARVLPAQTGRHDLPASLEAAGLPDQGLIGLGLSRADRVVGEQTGYEYTFLDPWWFVYAPAGASPISISLPAEANPFSRGDEVLVAPTAAGFSVPYDHDLFPTELIVRRRATQSSDDYAMVKP